jgi:ABC-type multidrug transport system fused ATPase/permease subunit
MELDSNTRQEYLLNLIERCLTLFERKRQRDKFLALGLKLVAALLSASVTVALGVTFSGKSESLFKNLALILSAIATVINTWDAFFNHRTLWVRHTVAANRLRSVKDELEYYIASGSGAITESQSDEIFKTYRQIMTETNQAWENLRKEEPTGTNRSP